MTRHLRGLVLCSISAGETLIDRDAPTVCSLGGNGPVICIRRRGWMVKSLAFCARAHHNSESCSTPFPVALSSVVLDRVR